MSQKWIKDVTMEVTAFPATGVTKSFGQVSGTFNIPFNYDRILFVNNAWFYPKADYEKIKRVFEENIRQDANYIMKVQGKQKEIGEALKSYTASLPVDGLTTEKLTKKNS